MSLKPDMNSFAQLTAMVGQLVRQNQTLLGHIDRVATSMAEMAQDLRAQQSATTKGLASLRSEMHGRFDTVGVRFDESEERLVRLERSIDSLRSDILRLENGVLSAQQSALQAHLKLDDDDPEPSRGT
jgi:chromosome segregation ATPase